MHFNIQKTSIQSHSNRSRTKLTKFCFNIHTFICFSLHSVFFYSHLNIKTRLNTFLQTKVYLVKFLRTFLSLAARFDTLELYKVCRKRNKYEQKTNIY